MRTVQDIAFGVTGQVVYFDCPEGRPSAVTSAQVFAWDVSDDDIAEAALGSPSVETNPNTTVDAASGDGQSNPRTLNVTATTGFVVDRSYLVTSADGLTEWFDVVDIDSGNYVTARQPLHNAYASADTVQSTRIQATVDSTWIAGDENLTPDALGPNPRWRIRWVYVVGGKSYVADSYFNVVRYPARHGLTPQDIDVLVPGWLDTLPVDYRANQGRRLIDDAYREVRMDLHQIDLAASSIAESEIVDELARHKVIELGEWARYMSGSGDSGRAEMAGKRYAARLDAVLRLVSRVPIRDTTGAATPIVSVGLTRR